MKYLSSFCFLLTLTPLYCAKLIIWGQRNATDYLLYRENIIRFPVEDFLQEIYVAYPKLGTADASRAENVTAIYVYDGFTNSSGAVPIRAVPLKKTDNAKTNSTIIILRSQRSQGINSTIEIYGQ